MFHLKIKTSEQLRTDNSNLNGNDCILITPPLSPPKTKPLSFHSKGVRDVSSLRKQNSCACMKGIVYEVYKTQPKLWLQQERIWLRKEHVKPITKARRQGFVGRRGNRIVSSVIDTETSSKNASREPSPSSNGGTRNSKLPTPESSASPVETRGRKSTRGAGQYNGMDVANIPFEALPDYCPDMSVLDKRSHPRPLRAEWKGPPLDLSNDPHYHLLHPAEVHLASTLRLPCMVYLDNKRRIFAEWHYRKQQGLGFRKTDAQRASRVDVNKASRLWKAFHEEGFFDD
ncbi:Clr6 associated factor 2 [Schizosaccharomyces cryophilus OY26]|uniref:Clr6 associated factor 2 n=1 Tax=Schizosaccharomyces cryophilus (strain OY26 / ATCC MYA-4695 / CBS 11777 / NBRC 106824 / NRRL Y48691) TaxID=653667 RepID=S9VV81_SCHCR|nr:Clr6 associated factor 2 [Schizosaccharomyces cryophilus OY26]EPY49980.1 Clr6 associated factor 2 [Schizosaccharomyces cryophilus OY26]